MKTKSILLLAVALYLSACAVNKDLVPTGGSKADGTVDLSYEFGIFEKPNVDTNAAQISATERCKAWGYQSAQAFGGAKTACQAYDGYGSCVRTLVTVTYQCIGGTSQ